MSYGRTMAGWLAAAMMLGWSCGGAASGTDAEKRARIERMYAEYSEDFPQVRVVSAQELAELRGADDVVLVDVRTPEEQAVSMIPGAVTQEEFEAEREKYAGLPVVTYCTIGARSGEYAAKLRADGVDVRNLEGSILAWTHAGGELAGPEGPTKKVHVYGKRWNLAAEGYEAVW